MLPNIEKRKWQVKYDNYKHWKGNRMIKRILRIIGYFILFAVNAGLLWFFHSFLNLTIMAVMVFLPVLSILGTKWVSDHLEIQWEGPYESMNKGEEFLVHCRIQNPTWLGIMSGNLKMEVSNLFYGTSREHELRVPIRAQKGQTITYPVVVSQCGMVEFRIQSVILEDFLGFTAFRREFPTPYTAVILPNKEAEVETDMNGYTLGMEEVEESTKKGSDFSEVQDVREYQPGDKMQNIHWKLSVKKDILMVKERVSMSSRQLFLVLELHDNEEGLLEEILDCTYGIALLMLKNQLPLSLVWWSVTQQELVTWKVDYEEQLEEGFRMIYYEQLYSEQTLGKEMFQMLRGSDSQFLWVGNRNFGIGDSLMEYGTGAGVFYGILS